MTCVLQLVQFGGQRSEIVEFFEGNQKALQHLLLKGWDPSYETMPYPPATGDYALYTVNDLLDSIDFAWENVSVCVCCFVLMCVCVCMHACVCVCVCVCMHACNNCPTDNHTKVHNRPFYRAIKKHIFTHS